MTVALCSALSSHLFGSLVSESEESIYVDVFFVCVFLLLLLTLAIFQVI